MDEYNNKDKITLLHERTWSVLTNIILSEDTRHKEDRKHNPLTQFSKTSKTN